MKKTDFAITRVTAMFEGSSLLLLLFIAVPLKYGFDNPIGVKIIGPIHGFLFLSFVVLLLLHGIKRQLTLGTVAIGFLVSFIPFGTFVFKAKMLPKD